MALYEYVCSACGAHTEKRMPMSDVVQIITCPSCGAEARKAIGAFAVVGRAEESPSDGPAPWESEGADEGHTHGPGGHTHGDDFDF